MMQPHITRICVLGVFFALLSTDSFGNKIMHAPFSTSNNEAERTYFGNASINDEIYADSLTVYGNLFAKNSEILGQLNVSGQAKIVASKFHSLATITGYLHAQHSMFLGDLRTASNNIALASSEAKNIIIKKSTSQEMQILTLSGQSKVSGCIKFESGKGVIRAEHTVILPDCIIGAQIERY